MVQRGLMTHLRQSEAGPFSQAGSDSLALRLLPLQVIDLRTDRGEGLRARHRRGGAAPV